MRLVGDSEERVVDDAEKLLAQRAVNVCKGVRGERRRVVCVPDGRCFGAGRASQDEGRCAKIKRGDNSCGQEGDIDGGGEGEAQVAKGDAAEVGSNGRGVGFKELVHPVQRGVCRITVDWRDVRVFEALNKLVESGVCHVGGLTN